MNAITLPIALAGFPPAPPQGAREENRIRRYSNTHVSLPAVETAGYKEFSPFGTLANYVHCRFRDILSPAFLQTLNICVHPKIYKNSKIPLEFFRVCNYNRLQNNGYKKAFERDSFFPLVAFTSNYPF